MNSTIAILGDLHFGIRNHDVTIHRNVWAYLSDVFIPFLEKNKIDTVVQTGDIFDKRGSVSIPLLHECKSRFFDALERKSIRMISVLGNHDVAYRNTNHVNSPSLLLTQHRNITVVSEPATIRLGGMADCLFVPWITKDNQQSCMNSLAGSGCDTVFGHFEIDGFEMNGGTLCKSESLSPKHFQRFKRVYSGHFHKRSTSGNILYVGTPYDMDFGEHADPKGFHTLDLDDGTLTFHENPRKIHNKIIYVTGGTENSDVIEQKYRDTIVQITVQHEDTKSKKYHKFVDEIQSVAARVIIKEIHPTVQDMINQAEAQNNNIDMSEDTLTIIRQYISSLDETNNPDLISTISAIYNEARNA